jgi:putative transcriptional regulator
VGLRALALLGCLTLTALPGVAQEPAPEAGNLTGQLLVATPAIGDPRFARTVIFMVRHDRTGAIGIIVNRPVGDSPLAAILERLGLDAEGARGSVRVHYGGPVEPRRGFVLHTTDWSGRGTLEVGGRVGMTTSPDVFDAIASNRGPRLSLFALGYAGWAPGQLESEIARGSWIAAPADEALLFDDDHATKWQRATDRQVIRL